jgi:hypothetical protein
VGVTGLSLLAFLGGDHLRFTDNLEKGLDFLLRSQDHSGLIGPPDEKYMYGHAMATLALCEALLKTGNAKLREPAQRAVDFLVAAQNPKKGWRYKERSRDNDSSVTAWAVLALWGAEMAGLSFPKAAYDGALAWYAEATDEQDLRTGYVCKRDWRMENLSPNNHFDYHPTSSACACLARYIIQRKKGDGAYGALDQLTQDPPQWKQNAVDYYYWFFGSAILLFFEGPDGKRWRPWAERARAALTPNQRDSGCALGSWEVDVDKWAFMGGGRVYATAINVLTLELVDSTPGILRFKGNAHR